MILSDLYNGVLHHMRLFFCCFCPDASACSGLFSSARLCSAALSCLRTRPPTPPCALSLSLFILLIHKLKGEERGKWVSAEKEMKTVRRVNEEEEENRRAEDRKDKRGEKKRPVRPIEADQFPPPRHRTQDLQSHTYQCRR